MSEAHIKLAAKFYDARDAAFADVAAIAEAALTLSPQAVQSEDMTDDR